VLDEAESLLRRWRRGRGLRQGDVADLVGRSEAMVCRVELGSRSLSPLEKARWAQALGVRVRDLFEPEEPEAEEQRE
jgi:transcriptional regulator with XRE-family HTH domain